MKIKSIRQCKNLKNKTILVRCDFDVPLSQKAQKHRKHKSTFKILDNSRLKACVPTIEFLLKKQVKQIILIGHLGRPDGKVVANLSLEPVQKELTKLLKKKIDFYSDILNSDFQLPASKIVMLENLRFHPRENLNCKKWAKKLSRLADIYVNEAFAVSHRNASSINAIQNYLPSYAGLHLEQEIKNLSSKFNKPLTVIIGGAKIETKLPVIKKFITKADHILIGGGVANTFLLAKGINVKNSLIDKNYISAAKQLLKKQETRNKKQINSKIILPSDYHWSKNKILDIGPQTIHEYSAIIKKSKTIIWNGPLGYFEDKKFKTGTEKIAQSILKNTCPPKRRETAKIIIGGGETIEILKHLNTKTLKHKNIFISTGGGAMLEFLAGKKMPGLKKLI